ncbi:MAG: PIG-L family deacetylase [Crocinitomicaceae bacterium TMED209]|nr:MAG: PIG-L family deacetylase [Crocinitomicaceae bacterium TMED209]|tara:strand:- start:1766 stop:2458 length:693 start_codon:yes stop_codon:yes gene_type:complete
MIIKKCDKKKVLCVVAHPDDEALGVGGTLIKHSKNKDKVELIILSEGESAKKIKADKNPDRLASALNWSKIAKVNLYKVFNYPDQKIDTIPQLKIVNSLEEIIENLKPDIVYIHHPNDINKDHQIAAQATLVALRPISYHKIKPEIRTFETPSSTDQAPSELPYIFRPNFYVDIQSEWNEKLLALKAYSKELKPFPHPRSIKAIEALAIKRGSEAGLKKAEAFCIIRKIW